MGVWEGSLRKEGEKGGFTGLRKFWGGTLRRGKETFWNQLSKGGPWVVCVGPLGVLGLKEGGPFDYI